MSQASGNMSDALSSDSLMGVLATKLPPAASAGLVVQEPVAATPPLSACFYPLAVALGKTFKAYKKAKGNKNEAKMLAERAQVSPSARASGVSCEREGCFGRGHHATR